MSKSSKAELKFEAAVAELETLVRTMESGEMELEASITAYQRGVELLKHCRSQLDAAETKIRILEDGELKDFLPDSKESA
ncbi:MAG TPA: exodeoxyribonuclease VII small subunit [Rhodocyclaceae bacterium]|nr:exodeoxyribonuclease VII small subunit [Rhodocyclaceae bacterium]